MSGYLNPAKGYRAFHEIAHACRRWTLARAPSVLGYGREHIANRITQRFVGLALQPFLYLALERFERGAEPLPEAGEIVRCGGFVVDTASGRLVPHAKLTAVSLGEFAAYWGYALLMFVRAAFSPLRVPAMPVT